VNNSRINIASKDASGCLYIVATPIGNMLDISQRAIEVLQSVAYIICEDSRVTQKLLSHCGINKPMMVCNDYTESKQVERVINLLSIGHDLALVSDAGTPLISDPGYLLVRAAHKVGMRVSTIPGPCSVVAALSISGLPTNRFTFIGFLESKREARRRALEEIVNMSSTIVCFEATRRLLASLADILDVLGNRSICMARELTKTYEEIWQGNVEGLIAHCQQHASLKGEAVLVIGGSEATTVSDEEIQVALSNAMMDLSLSDAVEQVSTMLGAQRRRVYQLSLKLKK